MNWEKSRLRSGLCMQVLEGRIEMARIKITSGLITDQEVKGYNYEGLIWGPMTLMLMGRIKQVRRGHLADLHSKASIPS